VKAVLVLIAVLLVFACPPIGVAVLVAELGVCGGLAVLIVRHRPFRIARRSAGAGEPW